MLPQTNALEAIDSRVHWIYLERIYREKIVQKMPDEETIIQEIKTRHQQGNNEANAGIKKRADLYRRGSLSSFVICLCLISCMFFSQKSQATDIAKKNNSFQTKVIVGDLKHPWGMTILPNGDFLITERAGALKRINITTKEITEIQGLPEIKSGGQGGLLDVELDPNFETNRFIYFSFVAANARGARGTEVARAKLLGDTLTSLEVIFRASPKVKNRYHFGSRLVFENEDTLFVSLGERYSYKEEAQDLRNHFGKLVRIHSNGSIPKDNPFVGTKGAAAEIFSYGHRNIQGLTIDANSGQLWAHEHGPKGGDELNIINPAKNYGWPLITYGVDYSGAVISEHTHKPGMEQPIEKWVPSIAPSGLAFYYGDAFPEWQGNLFMGALAKRHLLRLQIKNNRVVVQERLLTDLGKRIRDLEIDDKGHIFVITDENNGELLKLSPPTL